MRGTTRTKTGSPLIRDKKTVPIDFFVFLINEYVSKSFRKKDNSLEKLGTEVGARLYEGQLPIPKSLSFTDYEISIYDSRFKNEHGLDL